MFAINLNPLVCPSSANFVEFRFSTSFAFVIISGSGLLNKYTFPNFPKSKSGSLLMYSN